MTKRRAMNSECGQFLYPSTQAKSQIIEMRGSPQFGHDPQEVIK